MYFIVVRYNKCPAPAPVIENAVRVEGNDTSDYTCTPGYEMSSGDGSLVCTFKGWYGKKIVCSRCKLFLDQHLYIF